MRTEYATAPAGTPGFPEWVTSLAAARTVDPAEVIAAASRGDLAAIVRRQPIRPPTRLTPPNRAPAARSRPLGWAYAALYRRLALDLLTRRWTPADDLAGTLTGTQARRQLEQRYRP